MSQTSLTNLADEIEDDIVRITRRAMQRTALAIDQALVLATRVDTGRARANWIVSVGSAPEEPRPAFSEGSGGSTQAHNTQGAIGQGQTALINYKKGDIYISNNVNYIGFLDDKYNFIDPAIKVGIDSARGI